MLLLQTSRILAAALDDFGDRPLIVRSSSLLEDRMGAGFCGKYKSLFLPNGGTKHERLAALMDATPDSRISPASRAWGRSLIDLLPEYAGLAETVRVIDIPRAADDRILRVIMNADLDEAMGLRAPPGTADAPGPIA